MRPSMYRSNANKYAAIHNESIADEASPHKLIQMLIMISKKKACVFLKQLALLVV